jgi:hypothetical protein
MTTTPQIKIVDVTTGEEIVREMNDVEFAQYEADQAAQAVAQAAANAKAAQRRAILDHLKITEEEARILLGGN